MPPKCIQIIPNSFWGVLDGKIFKINMYTSRTDWLIMRNEVGVAAEDGPCCRPAGGGVYAGNLRILFASDTPTTLQVGVFSALPLIRILMKYS